MYDDVIAHTVPVLSVVLSSVIFSERVSCTTNHPSLLTFVVSC